MSLLDWLRKGRQGEAVRVRRLVASRAVYESEELQRVEVMVEIEGPDRERLTLDMNTQQAAQLIRQLVAVHDAIHPPLRARGQVGGIG